MSTSGSISSPAWVRGMAAVGVDEVVAMSEPCRVAERAWAVLAGAASSAGPVPSLRSVGSLAGDADGTAIAAAGLADLGVGCVVTVGGDGTHRAVAAGWPDVIFASVPGGTNNAFRGRRRPDRARVGRRPVRR